MGQCHGSLLVAIEDAARQDTISSPAVDEFSHSLSLDYRRRPAVLRTAMATQSEDEMVVLLLCRAIGRIFQSFRIWALPGAAVVPARLTSTSGNRRSLCGICPKQENRTLSLRIGYLMLLA